jgi:shikimate dehydrogenase
MSEHNQQKPLFGLIGRSLSHSFSRNFFLNKFSEENIIADYQLFELPVIADFTALIKSNAGLKGLNVTIPYKQEVVPFLDELDASAMETGAVNCIAFQSGKSIGYNTDVFGFKKSLENTGLNFSKAIILGSGGASLAVRHVLNLNNIEYKIVSRTPRKVNEIGYAALNAEIIDVHKLIINTTPLGMYPDVDSFPLIPYEHLTHEHLCFDLVYNPEETAFILKAKEMGAQVKNGLEMLYLQAEKSWEIWNRE